MLLSGALLFEFVGRNTGTPGVPDLARLGSV